MKFNKNAHIIWKKDMGKFLVVKMSLFTSITDDKCKKIII